MRNKMSPWGLWSAIAITCLMTLACGLLSNTGTTTPSEATPTSTEVTGGIVATQTPEPNPCEDLSGTIELQLLVGPSDAVGLDPYTIANIPFVVVSQDGIFIIEGGGPVQYYQDVYEAEWGSFSVTFEGETTISGGCIPNGDQGTLNVIIEMVGSQTVEVVVEGMTTTYPWEGTPQLNASFPLKEGAQQAGEGWLLILHLN